MRILHSDAIENKEHSLSHHAESNKMLNHSGLTLIAPKHMKFASILMSPCHQ